MARFEKFTGQWVTVAVQDLLPGDLFRVLEISDLGVDLDLDDIEGQWFVAVGPPFMDSDGSWTTPAIAYPDGTRIH